MYIYIQRGVEFDVGFFDPQGNWISESIFTTQNEAATRVHFLNGGI